MGKNNREKLGTNEDNPKEIRQDLADKTKGDDELKMERLLKKPSPDDLTNRDEEIMLHDIQD